MPVTEPGNQIYPQMDSEQDVIDKGISMLPITQTNSLVGLLMTYRNTLLKDSNGHSEGK